MEFSDHSSHEGEMACEAMLAADYRTRVMAPVIRNHAVLQVPPVLQIKCTASKKADKLKVPPCQIWLCFLPAYTYVIYDPKNLVVLLKCYQEIIKLM